MKQLRPVEPLIFSGEKLCPVRIRVCGRKGGWNTAGLSWLGHAAALRDDQQPPEGQHLSVPQVLMRKETAGSEKQESKDLRALVGIGCLDCICFLAYLSGSSTAGSRASHRTKEV